MRRLAGLGVFAIGVTLAISGVGIMSVSATPPSPTYRIVMCHTTGAAAGSYVQLEVEIPSSEYLDGGRSSHRDDIIPPYTYGAIHYPGKNWTPGGQAIWLAGCTLGGDVSASTAMNVESGPGAVAAGVAPAGAGDAGTSEVIGIILSTIGFLAMGLGLIAYRRREG